jgi:chromosome segregation ATPase
MDNGDAGRPSPSVPDEELARQLAVLDEKIDAALELIRKLRAEKTEVEARLAESEGLRTEAAQRLAALLDSIDTLL